MSIPIHCSRCGYRGISRAFSMEDSSNIKIGAGTDMCPQCGGRAQFQSGTYDFVGNMMSAFREVSREDIAAFRDIAEAVKAGHATKEEAESQVAELGTPLAAIWKWTNENGGALSVILGIVTLYLTLSAQWSSDGTADKLQASVDKQTQVQQMIVAELKKLNSAGPLRGISPRPKQQMRPITQPRTPVQATPTNRHERRKAAAKARRDRAR